MKIKELQNLQYLLELYSEYDYEFLDKEKLREMIISILRKNNIISYQVSEVNEMEDK
tara:strand:+ start:679 stop:849 length:171 start_codon:yes stop_codon:yes gene_type:complete